MAEYGYCPLEDDRYHSRPGLVYVSTIKTSSEDGMAKGNSANAVSTTDDPSDKDGSSETADPSTTGSQEPSAAATEGGELPEPDCQIIVHTVQVDPPRTQYASDHFSLSLFVTLCCFLPFGIVGLVKNHSSRVKAVAGDYDAAVADSRTAFRYALAGCIIGTVCYMSFVILSMVVLVLTLLGQNP